MAGLELSVLMDEGRELALKDAGRNYWHPVWQWELMM